MADTPQHLAFIVDGNRRWAKERGLPAWQGHLQALDTLEQLVGWCNDAGVKYLTTYLFSTENWGRAEEELAHMFGEVFGRALDEYFPRIIKQNVKVRVFGELTKFPEAMQRGVERVVEQTTANAGLIWNLCLDYGGRAELVRSVKRIASIGVPSEQITEQTIADNLYSAGIPDPDMVIRTSGEQRLSGFLLWQAAYAELYFVPVYFPALTKVDFDAALAWYAGRDRRYGK